MRLIAWYIGHMITIIPIEPLNDEHALLVIEAFNRFFINKGGQQDGYGNGYGRGLAAEPNGDGWGYCAPYVRGNAPEEWLIDEISMKPTGGHI